jgi:hypothetical protein
LSRCTSFKHSGGQRGFIRILIRFQSSFSCTTFYHSWSPCLSITIIACFPIVILSLSCSLYVSFCFCCSLAGNSGVSCRYVTYVFDDCFLRALFTLFARDAAAWVLSKVRRVARCLPRRPGPNTGGGRSAMATPKLLVGQPRSPPRRTMKRSWVRLGVRVTIPCYVRTFEATLSVNRAQAQSCIAWPCIRATRRRWMVRVSSPPLSF